jgi:flagellar biosynthesis/type III secretory pathway protein FliH
MDLSNLLATLPKPEWALTTLLKKRVDLQADYQKKNWDSAGTGKFESWSPKVLSQEEIAALKQQPDSSHNESPVSGTPEAFLKDGKPPEVGEAVVADTEQSESSESVVTDADADAVAVAAVSNPDVGSDAHGTDARTPDPVDPTDPIGPAQAGEQSDSQHHSATGATTHSSDTTAELPGVSNTDLVQAQQASFDAGKAAGMEAGLAQGLAQGLAAGEAAGRSGALSEVDTAIAALTQAAKDMATLNDDATRHFEPLKRLALHLAEELVRGELMLDSSAIERLVQAALEHIDNPGKRVRVALHPDDMAAIKHADKELGAGVVMVSDKTMLRGSVRVTNNDAVVQDLIDNRLSHLADELLIDTSTWLDASQVLQQGADWGTKASVLQRMHATEDAQEVNGASAAKQQHVPHNAEVADHAQDIENSQDAVVQRDVSANDQAVPPGEQAITGIDQMGAIDALDDEVSDFGLNTPADDASGIEPVSDPMGAGPPSETVVEVAADARDDSDAVEDTNTDTGDLDKQPPFKASKDTDDQA